MKTLTIKDLIVTEELDSKTMSAVHGGMLKGIAPYWGPLVSVSSDQFNFAASQELGQSQNTLVNNGNNVAFACGIDATVKPHQTGTNTINFR